MRAGRYTRTFDIRHSRFELAPGVYFLNFDASDYHENLKLIFMQ
jgi:hypothetical protein